MIFWTMINSGVIQDSVTKFGSWGTQKIDLRCRLLPNSFLINVLVWYSDQLWAGISPLNDAVDVWYYSLYEIGKSKKGRGRAVPLGYRRDLENEENMLIEC